jgi:hypothetical protein
MKQPSYGWASAFAGLVACGAATLFPTVGSASQTATAEDACTLLTAAEVSTALGVKVDPGKRPVETDPTLCNWRESGKPEGPARNVLVTLIQVGSFEHAKQPSHNLRKTIGGVGDEAYFFQPSRLPVNLFVKTGSVYFKIMARSSVTDPAAEQNGTIDKALAAKIIKKLQSR